MTIATVVPARRPPRRHPVRIDRTLVRFFFPHLGRCHFHLLNIRHTELRVFEYPGYATEVERGQTEQEVEVQLLWEGVGDECNNHRADALPQNGLFIVVVGLRRLLPIVDWGHRHHWYDRGVRLVPIWPWPPARAVWTRHLRIRAGDDWWYLWITGLGNHWNDWWPIRCRLRQKHGLRRGHASRRWSDVLRQGRRWHGVFCFAETRLVWILHCELWGLHNLNWLNWLNWWNITMSIVGGISRRTASGGWDVVGPCWSPPWGTRPYAW